MALGACKGYEGVDRIFIMETKEILIKNSVDQLEQIADFDFEFDSLGLFVTDFWNNDLKRQDLAVDLLNGGELFKK
jgi:hypothetical protein